MSKKQSGLPEPEPTAGMIITGIISVIVVVAGIAWLANLAPKTKAERALESYNSAVELCGAENIEETQYTNGNTDFDCKDYSIVE